VVALHDVAADLAGGAGGAGPSGSLLRGPSIGAEGGAGAGAEALRECWGRAGGGVAVVGGSFSRHEGEARLAHVVLLAAGRWTRGGDRAHHKPEQRRVKVTSSKISKVERGETIIWAWRCIK
jgi:hypothetical protein